jgi:hypothetical protein
MRKRQAYQWWGEALHGVCKSPSVNFRDPTPNGTSFPEPGLSAATFNSKLFSEIGRVIGKEGRAMANAGNSGLTYWVGAVLVGCGWRTWAQLFLTIPLPPRVSHCGGKWHHHVSTTAGARGSTTMCRPLRGHVAVPPRVDHCGDTWQCHHVPTTAGSTTTCQPLRVVLPRANHCGQYFVWCNGTCAVTWLPRRLM